MNLDNREKKEKKRADAVRLINFYIVPNWQDNAYEIERTATIMRNQNYSVSKHKNKIAIENMLGKEVANRVYPDERKVPKRFETIRERLQEEIQSEIRKNGFAIAEVILKTRIRVADKKGNVTAASLKEKEDVMKRAILIEEKYKINKIWSEKKKKEYGYERKTPNTIHIILHKN